MAPHKRRRTTKGTHEPNKRSRGSPHLDKNQIPMVDLKNAIASQTGFALRLARKVALSKAADSNLALSPLSIHAILALVAAGASGRTLDQFLSVLGSGGADELQSLSSRIVTQVLADGSASGGPRLSFACGGWIDHSVSLNPSFKKIATSVYKAEVKSVDFKKKADEARCEVNSWAENETSGLIKDLLPSGSVDSRTRLLFANALYFKGAWDQEFDASKTKNSKFHLLNGDSVRAPFMTSQKQQLLAAYDGFKVLRLPYKQGEDMTRQFAMYIFLPDARNGLWSLAERLSSESGFLDRYRPWKLATGKFKLPRFKITFGFKASQVLNDMGLILPFTAGADLSEMVGCKIEVSNVIHKSVVEVNEEGTEAAAATATAIMLGCKALRPHFRVLDFEADHPFLYLIREDRTGAVLFVGHVLNPLDG